MAEVAKPSCFTCRYTMQGACRYHRPMTAFGCDRWAARFCKGCVSWIEEGTARGYCSNRESVRERPRGQRDYKWNLGCPLYEYAPGKLNRGGQNETR